MRARGGVSVLSSRSNIDGLVQERRTSSALAMELCLSCINPSICSVFAIAAYKYARTKYRAREYNEKSRDGYMSSQECCCDAYFPSWEITMEINTKATLEWVQIVMSSDKHLHHRHLHISWRWLCARPKYLQCASNGDTAVLHQAISKLRVLYALLMTSQSITRCVMWLGIPTIVEQAQEN